MVSLLNSILYVYIVSWFIVITCPVSGILNISILRFVMLELFRDSGLKDSSCIGFVPL